ncbi:MAG: RHS repeat domain-containing protein, partial [Coriobacteriia bacterium]
RFSRYSPYDIGYGSGMNGQVMLATDITVAPTTPSGHALIGVTVQTNLGGIDASPVYYSATDTSNDPVISDNVYRFGAQVDASTLYPNRYDWEMTITQRYADNSTKVETFTGQRDLLNGAGSTIGNAWGMKAQERLFPNDNGVSLLAACSMGFFWSDGQGGYTTDIGPKKQTLEGSWSNGFLLTEHDGTEKAFDTAGLLTTITDPAGNVQEFTYVDADLDTLLDSVQEIVDPDGTRTVFNYADGHLDNIKDYPSLTAQNADRTTTVGHDTLGRLTTITEPNPNGGTNGPVWTFGYKNNTNLMDSITDPDGKQTGFTFNNSFGTLEQITYHVDATSHEIQQLRAYQPNSLFEEGKGDTAGNASRLKVATNVTGSFTDESGATSTFELDRFGQPIETKAPDPDELGQWITIGYQRNAAGLVTKMTEAALSTGARETSYEYDTRRNLTKVTLPDGTQGDTDNPTKTWTYDATFNKATSFTDELGHQTLYTIDPQKGYVLTERRVIGLVDGEGNTETDDLVTTYTYTPAPQDPAVNPPAGLIHTVTDPLNRVTDYAYSYQMVQIEQGVYERQFVVIRTDPDPDGPGELNPLVSPVTITMYDMAGHLRFAIDPLYRVTESQYDRLGRLKKVISPDPDGSGPLAPQTDYAYYGSSLLMSATEPDPDGAQSPLPRAVTSYVYDGRGRVTSSTRSDTANQVTPLVTGTKYTYIDDQIDKGLRVETTAPSGGVTTQQYDALGQLSWLREPDPDGEGQGDPAPETHYLYDDLGRLVQVTDPRNQVTDYLYEYTNIGPNQLESGLRVTRTDPSPDGSLPRPVTVTEYDKEGRLRFVTDPLLHVTEYRYDNADRQERVIQPDPDGPGDLSSPTTVYGYDAVGNLKTVKTLNNDQDDNLGFTTSYDYDNLDRLIHTTDAQTGQIGRTSYTYDAAGNRLTLTDPDLNTTTWTYDPLNRVKTERNELNLVRQFEYDAVGNLTKRTDRNGRVIEYVYDSLSRPTFEYWKDGQNTVHTLAYAYDAAGRLLVAGDTAAGYVYGYDNADRATSTTAYVAGLTPSVVLGQKYDAAGNRTQLAATIGGTADLVNDYEFDYLGRMNLVTQGAQTGGNLVAPKRVDFGYDDASRPETTTRYAALTQDNLVATTNYGFDDASRLRNMAHAVPGVPPEYITYAWTFDRAGRITQEVSSTDGTAVYGQDETGQLTSANYSYDPPADQTFGYDANGNRDEGGYAVGTNNQMTASPRVGGVYSYQYDNEGNRTGRYVDANANGALDAGDSDITVHGWDYRNRLVSVTHYASYGAASDWVVEYAYDYANRLVKRTLDPDGDGGTAAIHQTAFVYDGDQILLQFEKTGPGDLAAGDLKHRYLWGPAVDQILADETVGSLQT